jgi:hypothetical protein
MKVKVIRPFSTWDATGKISGVEGDIIDVYRSTGLRLINQGFVIDYTKPVKRVKRKTDNDQE